MHADNCKRISSRYSVKVTSLKRQTYRRAPENWLFALTYRVTSTTARELYGAVLYVLTDVGV